MPPATANAGTTPPAGAATPYYGHSLSDELADCLYEAAKEHLPGHKIRTDFADGDPDFEAPFYLLKYTYSAAVFDGKWIHGFRGQSGLPGIRRRQERHHRPPRGRHRKLHHPEDEPL